MAAATITKQEWASENGAHKTRFRTALATNAEDGVTVALGWADVQHVNMSHVSASPVQSGMSWAYSSGTLTLYGAAASNLLDAATVSVEVIGKM